MSFAESLKRILGQKTEALQCRGFVVQYFGPCGMLHCNIKMKDHPLKSAIWCPSLAVIPNSRQKKPNKGYRSNCLMCQLKNSPSYVNKNYAEQKRNKFKNLHFFKLLKLFLLLYNENLCISFMSSITDPFIF